MSDQRDSLNGSESQKTWAVLYQEPEDSKYAGEWVLATEGFSLEIVLHDYDYQVKRGVKAKIVMTEVIVTVVKETHEED